MTEIPASQQLWQMAQMILCGWLIMLSSHEKQVLSRTGRWKYRRRAAGDFIFCVFWAIGLWLVLLQVSGGVVRNYIMLGLAVGAAGYQWLFRRRMEPFCRLLANLVRFVWRWFRRILLWPYIFFKMITSPWRKRIRKFLRKKQELAAAEENIIENENIF